MTVRTGSVRWRVLALALVVLPLSACGQADLTTVAVATPASAAAVARTAASDVGRLNDQAAHGHDHAGPDAHADLESSPMTVPTWDAASGDAAVRAAINAVTAFGADADADEWWRGLAPLLSPSAQAAYAATDPANVPIGLVRYGVLSAEGTPSVFVVEVDVGTDVGVYRVLMSRAGAGEPWRVERFVPPLTDEVQP